METNEKLDKLSALQMVIEDNREYYNGLKEDWMKKIPQEVKEALDKIDAEFNEKQTEIGKQINETTTEIELDVVNLGKTVKGAFLMGIYNNARETVDMKQLKGYAVAHPEVKDMMKTGKPYVTIRKIGKGE